MTEQIKVDDLVYVKFPLPCGCAQFVGMFRTVKEVHRVSEFNADTVECTACQKAVHSGDTDVAYLGGGLWLPCFVLRRIDPDATGDTERTEAEVPA